MERERFKSRLGFLLLSAGCAIGIGNVWKFPYMVGNNGGGAFVLFYIFFLVVLGVPIMTMEFAIGRASRKSTVRAYHELEKPGTKWHLHGYAAMAGNYVLMMFYTTVTGWMLRYGWDFLTGKMEGLDPAGVSAAFGGMLEEPGQMLFWTLLVVAAGFFICSVGLQKGVESITKSMMVALLVIMILLAGNSFFLEGAQAGLRFYLVPDFARMKEIGIFQVIVAAMNQSFFTLSLGIGAMLIFGSYLQKDRTLLGESVTIASLDTFVALVSGLIIFPACFAFGVNPDSGPSLIFKTLPNIFNAMPWGRLWGTLFFIFLFFASFSTILAVFENIMSCCMDISISRKGYASRKKTAAFNGVLLAFLSVPCVLGYNLWAGFQPFGAGTAVLDLEDFVVSNLLLPIGSLMYLLFCVSRVGWGFDRYREEANTGRGLKVPGGIRFYVTWILPFLVLGLLIQSLWAFFH